MVEDDIRPKRRVMAGRTIGGGKGRARCGVRGIVRLLPGREMALGVAAIRGRDLQAVIATDVATRAGNIGVAVGKRKIDRRGGVIYGGAKPTVKVVAGIAGLRELRRNVIRICCFLKIDLVTGDAGGGKPLELADSGALVAIITLHRSVRA